MTTPSVLKPTLLLASRQLRLVLSFQSLTLWLFSTHPLKQSLKICISPLLFLCSPPQPTVLSCGLCISIRRSLQCPLLGWVSPWATEPTSKCPPGPFLLSILVATSNNKNSLYTTDHPGSVLGTKGSLWIRHSVLVLPVWAQELH